MKNEKIEKKELTAMEGIIIAVLIVVIIAFILRCWSPKLPTWILSTILDLSQYSQLNQSPFWVSLFIVQMNIVRLGCIVFAWIILRYIVSFSIYFVEEILRSIYNLCSRVLPIRYIERPETFLFSNKPPQSRSRKIAFYTMSSILFLVTFVAAIILLIRYPECGVIFDVCGTGSLLIITFFYLICFLCWNWNSQVILLGYFHFSKIFEYPVKN